MRLIWLIPALLLLGGCVVTEQDLQSQRDLMEMKRRLADAERALKEIQEDQSGGVRARVETLSRNQADIQAGIDNLRVDMQSIQGRYDDQQRVREDLRQEITLLRDELSLQIADLEQRLNGLESHSRATDPAAARTDAPVSTQPAKPLVTPVDETAAGLYDRGLIMIRELKDYAGGREVMETFLKRYPNDTLAVNANYWVGETYYAEKNYDQAILTFEDLIQKYEDHPKVASAMLKQGLAFDAIGDRSNARLLLQRVSDQFPLAEEAKIAKSKLLEWGG